MADELEPTAVEEVAVEVVEVEEAPAVEETVEVVESKTSSKKKSSAPVVEEVVVEEPVANPGGIYEETGLTEAEVKAQAVTPAVTPTQGTGMIAFSSRNK
jgi:hypothetical protein